jgi:hypothetical protein
MAKEDYTMPENEKYPIREEWVDYYMTLEGIRRTGVVNMWGAAPYLQACFPDMSDQKSKDVLLSWISNYDELNERFGWQK